MLVLTRKKGEKIVIGETITVTILESRDGKVRLGIAAPPDVTVNRSEIHEKLHPVGEADVHP